MQMRMKALGGRTVDVAYAGRELRIDIDEHPHMTTVALVAEDVERIKTLLGRFDEKPRLVAAVKTLRDEFAMAALQSYMANPDCGNVPAAIVARDCYAIADAMLAERAK